MALASWPRNVEFQTPIKPKSTGRFCLIGVCKGHALHDRHVNNHQVVIYPMALSAHQAHSSAHLKKVLVHVMGTLKELCHDVPAVVQREGQHAHRRAHRIASPHPVPKPEHVFLANACPTRQDKTVQGKTGG